MTDAIRDLELRIYKLQEEHEELLEAMKDLKTNHFLYIEDNAAEMGLTNQKKRDLALEERLRNDETYQQLLQKARGYRDSIRMFEIDLGFEHRKFQRWYADKVLTARGLE